MRKAMIRIVCVWTCSMLVAGPAHALPPDEGHKAMTAKCVKVIDGDTLVIECDTHRITVDLDGVDAPELGQPWGKEVRSFVRKLVRGEKVEIVVTARTEEGATARITVEGRDLSALLVERGLAWATGDAELEALSREARERPCGLWTDPEPVPPWVYREATA
jgi:endonuclease YncB( thermonuclease family)